MVTTFYATESTMKTVAQFIREGRERLTLSQRDLSSQLDGYTIATIENGDRLPSDKMAKRLAALLDLPGDFFQQLREEKHQRQQKASQIRRALAEQGVDTSGYDLSSVRLEMRDGQAQYATNAARQIPIVGDVAAGGSNLAVDDGGYPVGQGFDVIEIPAAQAKDPNAFAVRVRGDSMAPVYKDGDRLLVLPSKTWFPGDDVIVKTAHGKCYLKRARWDGDDLLLESYNPAIESKRVPRNDLVFIYKVAARFM